MRAREAEADTKPRPWSPHPYQLQAVRWLLSHAGAGIFADPGLGKTSINLAALKVLKTERMLPKGALVIAPLRPLYNVWDPSSEESEPRKWTDFHSLTFSLLHGKDKEAALRRKADVYLVNPDGLPWLLPRIGVERLRDMVLVVDESTDFKHANTARFRLLRPYLRFFSRRWINTGTPSPNGLLDLFGQIYICDLGNALGQYITHYRRSFFQPAGYGGYTWVLQGEDAKEQAETEKRVYAAIEPLIYRLSERDYLKLPKIHGSLAHGDGEPGFVHVKPSPEAMKKFSEMEDAFFFEVGSGKVTAANAAVRHMKLRQVANGGIYLDREVDEWGVPEKGKRRWALLHDAKTEAAAELAEQFDGRGVVIAIEFRHDVERLRMHKLFRNTPAIGEGTPAIDRAIVSDWNRGKLDHLIVHPASFSKGSNAQRGGDLLIYHSMIWDFEDYDQLVRRFWRQGRTRPFYVRHIIADGTHDLMMAHRLRRKDRTQKGLLDALREYSRKRPKLPG